MKHLLGIFFYLRNANTGKVWKANYEGKEEKYEVTFAEDIAKFTKTECGIETELKIIPASNLGCEIRNLKVKNNTEEDVDLEITSFFKPVLSRIEDDISHPAFNNLFLKYELSKNGDLIVKRNKRGRGNSFSLGANLFLEGEESSKSEYEIDLSKVYDLIESGKAFSNKIELMTDSVVAFRKKLKIKRGEEAGLNLIISLSEDINEITQNLEYYRIGENVKREFGIARAKAEEEARYLNLTKGDLETYNMILPYVIHQNPMRSLYMDELKEREYKQSELWKYGISGDIPIILVTVQSANDIYAVKEMLKVHENLRVKGINTDLVILDYEKSVYERYVKDQIIQEILNEQIGYLQNISGGIFLLNVNEIEDENLLKFRANIIINASKGTASGCIQEMCEEYKRNLKNIGFEKRRKSEEPPSYERVKPNVDMENLKFYNGFGGFSRDRKRIYNKNK